MIAAQPDGVYKTGTMAEAVDPRTVAPSERGVIWRIGLWGLGVCQSRAQINDQVGTTEARLTIAERW
ncbi:DUF6009 family protein [Streptomyces sp. TR1341]|uniref:DUF6009 family protein n=1 Tax=Streptomyces sp. TR1341 TaxID=2601266 RepID=UPI00403E4AA0